MDIKDLKEKELLLGYYFQRKEKQELSMLSLFYMWRNWFKQDFLMDGKNLLAVKDDRLEFKPKISYNLKKQYKDRLNEYDTNFNREYERIKEMASTMSEQDFIEAIEAERRRSFGMILRYTKSNNINVYKEDSLLSTPPLSHCTDEITYFDSEAELYDYINSIDLHEYLGVPTGKFCCILPEHEDTSPSAHIYVTDNGTQIYKCFGCNQARTIISITEQLSGCKRHEAIDFIKQVYKIDYKPTEWVERQRKIMIDSALYLNSEEFKNTFPQFNKLIRTRKADIQRILIHMTKYVSNNLTLDGKPLFFASLNKLMQICEKKDKTKMSQSITLFALLNMLDKVDLERIPKNELDKAKHISAQYGFKKITNFYQFEEYGYNTLENSEQIAGTLLENNITLKGLSREYILRTFGKDLADKVFPQYKYENSQGTSTRSDYLTMDIARGVLETIQAQGYIFERDVNTKGAIGVQWKKSIQEILNSYGLKRVKLNKALKEQYGIECNGYPNIIVEDNN